MPRLKYCIWTFDEALKYLRGRTARNAPTGVHTVVEESSDPTDGMDAVAIVYHSTAVVLIRKDNTYRLCSGGFHTPTTKSRINTYSPARLYQEDYDWRLEVKGRTDSVPFHDGILVDRYGDVVKES